MVFDTLIRAGANGRTGKEWKKLLPYIRSRLGGDCNVSFFGNALLFMYTFGLCLIELLNFGTAPFS